MLFDSCEIDENELTWLQKYPHREPPIMDKSSWDTARKRPVSLNAWVFQCVILTFRPPLLTRSKCPRSVLQHWKGGEGVLAIDKKDAFWNNGRTPIKSVCFAQMCQHFCPWFLLSWGNYSLLVANIRIVNYLFFMRNKSLGKLVASSAKGCLFSHR